MSYWKMFAADVGRYIEFDRLSNVHAHRNRALRAFIVLGLCLRNQGIWALADFRFGQWVRASRVYALRPASMLSRLLVESVTGIYLRYDTPVGPGLYIGHFSGIFLGGESIGARCNISQGVTVGVDVGRGGRMPVIGDDVYIGPGAIVSGGITVGDRARIGANAVVNCDVPADGLAVGVPARIVKIGAETIAPDDPRYRGRRPA